MLCLICGSPIDANSSRKKYCSESCLLEARKQKSKAYREVRHKVNGKYYLKSTRDYSSMDYVLSEAKKRGVSYGVMKAILEGIK